MQNLTISPLSTLPQVRVLGRCAGTDPLTLFWTGSGIELLFTGSELWVELNADYDTMEPWVSVELDGAWISRFAVNPGTSRMCIFRGAAPGRAKHVRLLKDVQAMSEDPAHLLQVTAICHAGGEFLPLPAPRCRLEFIGDSITSGEGAIGAVCETDWISTFFSAENHYGRMTADALGAEYRVVSASGWGLVSGWDNDPRCTLAPCYTQVCGLAAGERNAALGAQQPYDFAAWPADAVILNLGTNDWNAFHNPPWVDPETGRSFKQTLADDGSFAPADAARLAAAVRNFLALVRKHNPHAVIVWAYGMLGSGLLPLLRNGLDQYRTISGDERVYLLELPEARGDTIGARQHPGAAAHRAAANCLAEFLRSVL